LAHLALPREGSAVGALEPRAKPCLPAARGSAGGAFPRKGTCDGHKMGISSAQVEEQKSTYQTRNGLHKMKLEESH